MKSILKYTLLIGLRDRLYIGLFISLIITFALAIFLGQTALNEEMQMTCAYIAGSSRIILSVGLILFVCLNLGRAFENREIEFIISKPISREKFVIAYLLSFLLVSLLIVIPLNFAIMLLTQANKIGLLVWSLTIFLELVIVISFSLLASLILKSPLSAILSSFGFYIICRLMGVFVMAIKIPESLAAFKSNILSMILKFLSVLFPRLDLFAQSKWLNYGIDNFDFLKIILIQSSIYIPLLIFMAFHDFKKKQF
jgi:ABC-type transport system involved in multi-copper enzyme maturation permease subunit